METSTELAEHFERSRSHLRSVAFRMLGSIGDADDAVQEAWLRASRAGMSGITNVTGWLTTIVARVCLDLLRARKREMAAHGADIESTFVEPEEERNPEDEAELAEAVGLALLVVLDRLGPAERVAFVLHDLFGMKFEQIAEVVERSPVAAKKLASRARHRVYGAEPGSRAELARHRHVVEAFLAASREGDVDALLAVLAPDVVRRADRAALRGDVEIELSGARRVAEETRTNADRARFARALLVNGKIGAAVAPCGRLQLVLALTIEADRIARIEVIADPERLRSLDLRVLDIRS